MSHLRAGLPRVPTLAELDGAKGPDTLGAEIWRSECATCHGANGEGTVLGSPINAADRPFTRAQAYDALVRGVAGTTMSAYGDRPVDALAAVFRHMQTLPRANTSRASWRLGTGEAARGAVVYDHACAGCHGAAGEGRIGPALAHASFQLLATPSYIATTIVRGRAGTPMPAFGRDHVGYARLSASDVLDVTAFVRTSLGRTSTQQGAH